MFRVPGVLAAASVLFAASGLSVPVSLALLSWAFLALAVTFPDVAVRSVALLCGVVLGAFVAGVPDSDQVAGFLAICIVLVAASLASDDGPGAAGPLRPCGSRRSPRRPRSP